MSDSRCSTSSHLGRTFVGAYRDDGECSDGFSVEDGALVWPAMALRQRSYGFGCARERREEGERRGRL